MAQGNGMTRRRVFQLAGAGAIGAGAMLAAAGCSADAGSQAKDEQAQAPAQPQGVTLTVYDPSGNVEITQTFAERLDTIEGKTIAFVGNSMWEEERTFALLQELMEAKYKDVKIITPDNFPRHSDDLTKAGNGIPEMLQEMGVDAAIVGNAG